MLILSIFAILVWIHYQVTERMLLTPAAGFYTFWGYVFLLVLLIAALIVWGVR